METSFYNNQFQNLKNSLISDIESELKETKETIYFTNTYFFLDTNNLDNFYSMYGIDGGVVMVDCYLVGISSIGLREIPLEGLLYIKTELEYFNKNKYVSQIS